jgi:hypothetical protein
MALASSKSIPITFLFMLFQNLSLFSFHYHTLLTLVMLLFSFPNHRGYKYTGEGKERAERGWHIRKAVHLPGAIFDCGGGIRNGWSLWSLSQCSKGKEALMEIPRVIFSMKLASLFPVIVGPIKEVSRTKEIASWLKQVPKM